MPVYVVVRLEARPDRLQEALELIRHDQLRAPQLYTSRRRSRLFQRLSRPVDLLRISEWESHEAYEQFQRSAAYAAAVGTAAAPPSIRYFERLTSYERMMEQVEMMACATISATGDDASALERFVTTEGRLGTMSAPGLISHEIYRSLDAPRTYLVAHSWRHLEDLERFRRQAGPAHERHLATLGATIDRFTGALVAEYPVPSPPDRSLLSSQT